jgi:NRPS condensation-like uncharacterized protein
MRVRDDRFKTQPFDCMLYFYQAVQEPRIRCLIHFEGRLDGEALRRAVDLSLGAAPLMGCAFDEARHRWTEPRISARNMLCIVEGPEDDALQYLLSTIDCAREPQLKLFLVKGAQSDALAAIVNHQVCDGAGFKQYLYLLADLYSKCARGEEPAPPAPGPRGLDQLLRNLNFGRKLNILWAREDTPRPDPAMVLPLDGGESPAIVAATIEAESLDALRRYARGQGVSVNDLLLTAYARALRRATGCGAIVLPCPVDLRKYQKPGQRCGVCNLTGSYTCAVDIAPGEVFCETLRKVAARMAAQKVSDACLKGPMLFHMAYHALPFPAVRMLFEKVSPVPVIGYTNLGVLDDARLRFGDCDAREAFISTALKRPPYFQLSISTFRGRCALTASLYASKADRQRVDDFLRQIVQELEDAAR